MVRVPICTLCYKDFHADNDFKGGWVEFSDFAPRPNGEVWLDEPPGMELFCTEHFPAAQALAHLPWEEALAELQRQFGVFSRPVYTPPKLTWWQWLRSWF